MKRYPAYKDSGVEWLGEVPEGWVIAPLKTALLRNDGGVWGNDPDGENDTIVLRSTEQTEFGNWCIDDPAPRKIAPNEFATCLLAEGDLLVTKSSGSSKHIGKTTLVDETVAALQCCFSNFMQRLRVQPWVSPRLLWYFLNNELARRQFDLLSSSTTGLANLSAGLIGQVILPLGTLPEQTAIAAFLDRETAIIDALVAEQRRLIDLLREKRQAVISHAVTKGLKPNAPHKPSGIDWLGDVPEGWEVARIKSIARMESGHTPDKQVAAYWEDGDIHWVSLNDTKYLKDHEYIGETAYQITQAGIDNSSARLLPAGVVVFSRDATIGRCAITTRRMAVSQHFIAWVPGEHIVAEFLLFCLRAMEQELERMTFGATLKTIGMPDVRKLSIALPTLQVQSAVVAHIRKKIALLDALISDAETAIALMQERRAALIAAAVTGKIDVRHLSPAVTEAA